MQNGFTDLEKWAEATGYEKQGGKLTGTAFQQQLFTIPSHINITDPYSLKTA